MTEREAMREEVKALREEVARLRAELVTLRAPLVIQPPVIIREPVPYYPRPWYGSITVTCHSGANDITGISSLCTVN